MNSRIFSEVALPLEEGPCKSLPLQPKAASIESSVLEQRSQRSRIRQRAMNTSPFSTWKWMWLVCWIVILSLSMLFPTKTHALMQHPQPQQHRSMSTGRTTQTISTTKALYRSEKQHTDEEDETALSESSLSFVADVRHTQHPTWSAGISWMNQTGSIYSVPSFPRLDATESAKRGNFLEIQQESRSESRHHAFEASQMASSLYKSSPLRNAWWKKLHQRPISVKVTQNVKWSITQQEGGPTQFTSNAGATLNTSLFWVTIRGFDPSDESVQRSTLLHQICGHAQPHPLRLFSDSSSTATTAGDDDTILVHSGLFQIAQAIFCDLKSFIQEQTNSSLSQSLKLVLCGHSIGGALSNLLLVLLTREYGSAWVERHVQNVFTFGSPPVARVKSSQNNNNLSEERPTFCPILQRLNLPPTLVQGYVQPWDPIPRLFTTHDPIYPLVGDMRPNSEIISPTQHSSIGYSISRQKRNELQHHTIGRRLSSKRASSTTSLHNSPSSTVRTELSSITNGGELPEHPQGRVLWPHGPPRLLRHVGFHVLYWAHRRFSPHFCWPQFRNDYQQTGNQSYIAVGLQNVFVAGVPLDNDSKRIDKTTNAWRDNLVPPLARGTVTLPNGHELENYLHNDYALTTFDISHVAEAIRSLIHHSHSSYGKAMDEYYSSSNFMKEGDGTMFDQ